MFSGFSGFILHVIRLSTVFSAPKAFVLPASKAGVRGWGGGWGGGGHDDAHCRLHHLQPFKLFRVSVLPKLFHVACFQNGGVWGGVGVKH